MTDIDLTVHDREAYRRDQATVRRGFWRKLRRTLGQVPFSGDILAAYYCAMDRQTPVFVRAVLMGAVAYFVLPADLIPDVLPGIGYADDASVIYAAINTLGQHIKPGHQARARAWLDGGMADGAKEADDPDDAAG